MLLSERRAKNAQQREALIQLKMERAQAAAEAIMKTDQYKISVFSAPDANMAVDKIVEHVVQSVIDPTNDFIDVLRSKGFRQAEIRRLVHKLYNMYCVRLDEPENSDLLYEDMVGPVAMYFCEHQELYSMIDPETMLSEQN